MLLKNFSETVTRLWFPGNLPHINVLAGTFLSAIPCLKDIARTNHKLVDHYDEAGREPNTARTDGKWEKSADLPVPLTDISAGWYRLDATEPFEP
jgi:hypothetical protein